MNTDKKTYLLCPQCGSRRFYVKDAQGKEHYLYILSDKSAVYATSGAPVPDDLDLSTLICADCAWYGPVRKLTTRFMY